MAGKFDFTKLRRLLIVHAVTQALLFALLVFTALNFQVKFHESGIPQVFLNSIWVTLAIQLLLFYPVSRFAKVEAEREIASSALDLSVDQQKSLRQRRLYGDLAKACVLIFFFTFVVVIKPKSQVYLFILSSSFFTFILTIISYLQCFNFAAKRGMAGDR